MAADPVHDQMRLEMAQKHAMDLWRKALEQPGTVESTVMVLVDDRDSNGGVLLRALGMRVEPAMHGDTNATTVVVPRDKLVQTIMPFDEELAGRLREPTPMKLTVLVMAFGGWSTMGLGRNVGQA